MNGLKRFRTLATLLVALIGILGLMSLSPFSVQGLVCKCGTGLATIGGDLCPCDITLANPITTKGRCLYDNGCTNTKVLPCSVTGTITASGPGCPAGGTKTLTAACGQDDQDVEPCPFLGDPTYITLICGHCPGFEPPQ